MAGYRLKNYPSWGDCYAESSCWRGNLKNAAKYCRGIQSVKNAKIDLDGYFRKVQITRNRR